MQGIEKDQIFSKSMTKKIAINPGSEFIFGDHYKIQIIPITEYTDLEGKNIILELGTKEQEFELSALEKPIIAISGARQDDNQIIFKTTIYDDDKVVVGNQYTIEIYNGQLKEITPEEYKNKVFSVSQINNTIKIDNTENSQNYTLLVITKLDQGNANIEEKYEEYIRQYTIPATNEYGISIGELSINKNSEDPQKIDILFNNSYKLNEIDSITYSIYNTNGFAKSGQGEFIPKQITSGNETYYTFTIDERLIEYGKYYIELQFARDNEVIEIITLEYISLET